MRAAGLTWAAVHATLGSLGCVAGGFATGNTFAPLGEGGFVTTMEVPATSQPRRPAPTTGPEPDPKPSDAGRGPLAVLFAEDRDAVGLLRLARRRETIVGDDFRVIRTHLGLREVLVVIAEPGYEVIRRVTGAVIDGHQPALIVAAGLAVSLTEDVHGGDLLTPDSCVNTAGRSLTITPFRLEEEEGPAVATAVGEHSPEETPEQSPDETEEEVEQESPEKDTSPTIHTGRLLTIDRPVISSEEREKLRDEHGAIAVDGETFAAADVCLARKTPFSAVRVIGGAVDPPLPEDVERLAGQRHAMRRVGAALRMIWQKPTRAKDLFTLAMRTDDAVERLGEYLAKLLREI